MACAPNRVRLLCMLSLTFGYFIVEVVVSRITSSLAMLSDSFHMLSDVIALVVALVAVRFAEQTQSTNKNTFGWIRAEVMGALVNAVFLTALCFTIILEAIERFTEPHEIEQPVVVITVGAVGLLVNLLGLCLFHGHAGGGGHGHSHGGHKKHKNGKMRRCETLEESRSAGEETNNLVGNQNNSPNGVNPDRSRAGKSEMCHSDSPDLQINGGALYEELENGHDSASQLNMRGVFLHVLGDALGSVIVVINAIIFNIVWKPCSPGSICENPCVGQHCADHSLNSSSAISNATLHVAGPCWVLYLDPTLCIIMVLILLYTTYPLLKESALILLQTVPKQIDMHQLNARLRDLEGVLAVHELHIWQLAGSRIIATAHIKCHDPTSYMDVAKRIKDFFHNEGIHATTIQPEFVTVNSESRISLCELSCRTQCAPKLCCGAVDAAKPPDGAIEPKNPCEAKTPTVTSTSATSLEIISESVEETSRPESVVIITREVESSL
ncbi:zinc transporter 1-like isoform X1 [Sinocyclocheilus anshuiensis]|uniref:zinc transporter 1-like isoform X1 n=1 Tax=Sinocyclocheilus anshuiensis TaxID=1608454 RepID=UPI0007B7CC0F|nr:PREDICTED: zinc transporter 1-like isoform X1 [Sinocyclocheilus anshuiensis]